MTPAQQMNQTQIDATYWIARSYNHGTQQDAADLFKAFLDLSNAKVRIDKDFQKEALTVLTGTIETLQKVEQLLTK